MINACFCISVGDGSSLNNYF